MVWRPRPYMSYHLLDLVPGNKNGVRSGWRKDARRVGLRVAVGLWGGSFDPDLKVSRAVYHQGHLLMKQVGQFVGWLAPADALFTNA